jgi:hypothetical protein
LKSESSDYAADMAMGAMFVATDYNTLSPPPIDKQTLLNMEFSTSSKPNRSQIHLIECARRNTVQDHMYIANDSDYQGGDPHFYNMGTIFVGSYGIPKEDTKIAEIWISYEVSLYRPRLSTSSADLDTAYFGFRDILVANPFGALGPIPDAANARNISVSRVSTAVLSITLPNRLGAYKLDYILANVSGGTLTVTNTAAFQSFIGCEACFHFPGTNPDTNQHSNARSIVSPGTIGAGDDWFLSTIVRVNELSTDGVLPSLQMTVPLTGAGVNMMTARLYISTIDRELVA